jgi:hypothetical protein
MRGWVFINPAMTKTAALQIHALPESATTPLLVMVQIVPKELLITVIPAVPAETISATAVKPFLPAPRTAE